MLAAIHIPSVFPRIVSTQRFDFPLDSDKLPIQVFKKQISKSAESCRQNAEVDSGVALRVLRNVAKPFTPGL